MSKNKENNKNSNIPIFGIPLQTIKIQTDKVGFTPQQIQLMERQRKMLSEEGIQKAKDEFRQKDPIMYDIAQQQYAQHKSPTSEIIYYEDNKGNLRSGQTNAGAMSGNDPLMQFYVEGVALGKPLGYIWNKGYQMIKPELNLLNVKYIKPRIGSLRKLYKQQVENLKNIYNRYTTPKTNTYQTYRGDQFKLMKYRLQNGGFDKLGITPDDVIYVPKGHPMYVEPNGRFMSHLESPVNARKFLLKSEATPLIDEYEGIASYSGSTKQFTQPTVGKWGTIDKETKSITGHEFQHAIDDVIKSKNVSSTHAALAKFSPKKGINLDKGILESNYVNPPGTDFSKIPSKISRYLRNNKGTELHARLGQIKNWFGITDPHQPITPDMWNYARRHYVNSIGGDNNMQQMFRAVTDPKKYLDWINPRVASQMGLIVLGNEVLNNEKQY